MVIRSVLSSHTPLLYVVLLCLIKNSEAFGTMISGVGVLTSMRVANSVSRDNLLSIVGQHVESTAKRTSGAPVRATVVSEGSRVVLVEEWTSKDEYEAYTESNMGNELESQAASLISESSTSEFFPEVLHIFQGDCTPEDIGILVRQNTANPANGALLRDVQRAAYERQMGFEPGCTCCIILADGSSEVKIIELWKTMDDFIFHESSEWHAQGEEKVVPLVTDMDCDFVRGKRLLY
mmetsp:Transcript_26427/g.45572  ORF Transcript_26427/g.45572 Transcript_26427/m.45572 type:complete len:236 (+) Transcript_26427:46-753(+)